MIVEIDSYLKTHFSSAGLTVSTRIDGVTSNDPIQITWFDPEEHIKRMGDRRHCFLSIQDMPPREDPDRRWLDPSAKIWRYKPLSANKIVQYDLYPQAIIADYQISIHAAKRMQIRRLYSTLAYAAPPFWPEILNVLAYGGTVGLDVPIDVFREDFRQDEELIQKGNQLIRSVKLSFDLHIYAWIFHKSPSERASFWNRAEVTFRETERNTEETFSIVPS